MWANTWERELKSGQYYDLLAKGFIPEDKREPNIYGLEFFHDAFRELSTARPVGLGAAPIPFTAIADYFRIYSLSEWIDFNEFTYIIRRMDDTILDLREKSKEVNNAAKQPDQKNNDNGRHQKRGGAKGPSGQTRRR